MVRELEECLQLTRKIQKLDERILELKSNVMSPKNQIITDMPKGGGAPTNLSESYLIKLEKLEYRKNYLISRRSVCWHIVCAALNKNDIDTSENHNMLKLRFYKGLSWKKCTKQMQELFPIGNWNENKIFASYRKVRKVFECSNN